MSDEFKIKFSKVKIITMVPKNDVDKVRRAICLNGAGKIGNYTFCSTSSNCIDTFLPNESANPSIGKIGNLEKVEEIKLETSCDIQNVASVVKILRETHPYEEPEIDIIPLIDETCFY